jgi:hypothetical protein
MLPPALDMSCLLHVFRIHMLDLSCAQRHSE